MYFCGSSTSRILCWVNTCDILSLVVIFAASTSPVVLAWLVIEISVETLMPALVGTNDPYANSGPSFSPMNTLMTLSKNVPGVFLLDGEYISIKIAAEVASE